MFFGSLIKKFKILNRLDLPEPKQELLDDYKTNFDRALKFTEYCGFDINGWKWNDAQVNSSNLQRIPGVLEAAGVPELKFSAHQCIKWCHFLEPIVSKAIERTVMVTIGQLWQGDQPIFNPSWTELREWSAGSGVDFSALADQGKLGINIHAWLTIDDGQVIEPTLHHSLAKLYPDKFDQFTGYIFCGYSSQQFFNNYQYFPMAVGRSFVQALAGGADSPLLAKSPNDLKGFPIFIFR